MENKAHALAAGAFVLAVTVLLIGLGIALFFTPNRIRSKKDQHKS